MNAAANKHLSAAIRKLSCENEVAGRLFKNFAGRQKDSRETSINRAALIAGADYHSMRAVFNQLDTLGAGRYIVGRHGHPSRIAWEYSIRSLGEIAMGQAEQPELVSADAVSDDIEPHENGVPTHTLQHEFQLRDDVRIKLELPLDINEKEAERLALFVKALPF